MYSYTPCTVVGSFIRRAIGILYYYVRVCYVCPQNRYHRNNPYHNHVHAADVLLTTDFLLKAKPLEVCIVHLCFGIS